MTSIRKPTIAALIPARYHSTRFEGKPLADIGGYPMIYHVYKNVESCRIIDYLAVATDDDRIERAVRAFGGNVIMTKDTHPTGTDRVAEAASELDADIVVNVQGDEPLVRAEMVEEAVQPLLRREDIQVTTLMTRITDLGDLTDTTVVKVVKDKNDCALFFTRAPVPYPKTRRGGYVVYKQIGLYAFRKSFLFDFTKMDETPLEMIEGVELLRAIENGYKVSVVETPYQTISVDTLSDLYEVRKVLETRAVGADA